MINIKIKLKELGITLSEFASILEISRPTLDTYISLYESGEIIPKEKYNMIFNKLFGKNINDKDIFMKILNKYHRLIEKDRILGTSDLEARKTNILSSIIRELKNDMTLEDSEESIYIFVNMLIRSYRKDGIFCKIAKYFLVLYGKEDINNISEEDEVYISNFHKIFFEEKNNMLKTDIKYLNCFKNEVEALVKKEEKSKEKIKNDLIDKVMKRLDELSQTGINIKDVNIKELLNQIKVE